MILERGSKILIVLRRLFESDHSRFFIGVVEDFDSGIAKVTGHTWLRDIFSGQVFRKDGQLTKIFAIASGTLIVYQLPDQVDLSEARFEFDQDGRFLLLATPNFRLDLSEVEFIKKKRMAA